jgi:hypothetical protein
MSTQSVFWLTFKTATNPVVDVTTLEQYAPVERSLTKYLTAAFKFDYRENTDYDTFEAFEKTGEDFIVYSSTEACDPGIMLRSSYIAGQWREQEVIEIEEFNEESGQFEQVDSPAANEVKEVLALFKTK